jgi:hypothetical protein
MSLANRQFAWWRGPPGALLFDQPDRAETFAQDRDSLAPHHSGLMEN